MKSVGEVMAMGRTFQESLQKALRGLETGIDGLTPIATLPLPDDDARNALLEELRMPGPDRLRYVADAFRAGHAHGRSAPCLAASTRGSWCRSRTSCARRQVVAEQGLARARRAAHALS